MKMSNYAIVWSLQNVRFYLYGITNIETHTDNQPLSFATTNRSPSSKIKRLDAFIEEFSPQYFINQALPMYALSIIKLNNLTDEPINEEDIDNQTEQTTIEESKNLLICSNNK